MDDEDVKIKTVEMHTGGEPLRIITSGFPPVKGNTILAKRRYVRENLDHFRKLLMFEPRGHYDMYGALLVQPDDENADLAAIFLHNDGYSTMCGHAVIALGRYAVDSGLLSTDVATDGEVPVFIQCPCGVVKTMVELSEGKSGRVKFVSVPAFAFKLDVEVDVEKYGKLKVDIGYGGAFYALISADKLDVDVKSSKMRDLVEAANYVTQAVKRQIHFHHPDSEDLAFLYGTIITDGSDEYNDDPDDSTANVCVFADNQVDRSPTGSGVTARIAVQYARKQIGLNQIRVFEQGLVGSKFGGKAVKETRCGDFPAVHVEVTGHAYYTGTSVFTIEKDDPFRNGFLLR